MRFNKVPDHTAHFNNKGYIKYIAIHTSLKKLEFLKIICSYSMQLFNFLTC